MPALYSMTTAGQLEPFLHQEWLLTNGLGGYAASTVVGCNTRRYHGLLVAATLPPVGRIVTLNRLGEIVLLDGDTENLLELSVSQFKDEFHPHGDQFLQTFELEDTARWTYEVEGVHITKELQLSWLKNVVGIRYAVKAPANRAVELRLLPFVSLRDFHATIRASANEMPFQFAERALQVQSGSHTLYMQADEGQFTRQSRWWFGHTYAIETERGLDDTEDLFNPGYFSLKVNGSGSITIWAALEPPGSMDWEAEIARRQHAVAAVCHLPKAIDPEVGPAVPDAGARRSRTYKLARAANDFVVYRKTPKGEDGTSIIAGYPWFADWGRDTMISLPGLLLVPQRFEQAKQVLAVFASYVSEGMIPNRFDDYNNEPHYNTVDASLWFVHACLEYLRLSNDAHTFEDLLLPACRSVIDGYRRGTRFNIHMDEADGLITQGDESTQLTWMDAKCDGTCFTPRQGKPVEINALWYHALMLMNRTALAEKVAASFRKAFWISPFRGLADVVNSPASGLKSQDSGLTYVRDTSIRPNQIFAVSLAHSPLSADQKAAVVEVVRRELLTPVGLRSLAKGDPNYKGRYDGPQVKRDAAYHNGTVWGWLMGPFLEAYLRVNHNSPEAVTQCRAWLMPLIDQLDGACVGQIAEIFEGDEPHRPVGCFAQAWSVAETLRLAVQLGV